MASWSHNRSVGLESELVGKGQNIYFFNKIQINIQKLSYCDFLEFFIYSICHFKEKTILKIIDRSYFCKVTNPENLQQMKYLFLPFICAHIYTYMQNKYIIYTHTYIYICIHTYTQI